jgi:hypothetical protein
MTAETVTPPQVIAPGYGLDVGDDVIELLVVAGPTATDEAVLAG